MRKYLLWSLFLAIVFSRIFLINSQTQIIGDGGDNFEFFGFQHLVKENIQQFKYPLAKTNTLRYPVGFELSYGYDGAFPVFTGAILGLAFSQPLSFNLTIVLIIFANLFCSFLFFHRLGKVLKIKSNLGLIEFISTLIFALSPYFFARINSHLNLAFIAGFPLLGYGLIGLYEEVQQKEVSVKTLILGWLGLLLIAAGSLQYLVLLVLNIFILSVILFFVDKNKFINLIKLFIITLKSNYKQVSVTALVFLIPFMFFYGGHVWAIFNGQWLWIDKTKYYESLLKPRMIDILIPNQYLHSFWGSINYSSPSIEKVVSLGVIELVLLVYLFYIAREEKLVKAFILFIITYLFIVSGAIPLYFIPEYGREILVMQLVFATATFILISRFRKTVLILILGFLFIERMFFTIQVSPVFPEKPAKIVQQQSGEAVLTVPLSGFEGYDSSLPYFFQKKIVGGYFHFTANDDQSNSFLGSQAMRNFVCDKNTDLQNIDTSDKLHKQVVSKLKTYKIETIVLDKSKKYYHSVCDNVRFWWTNFSPKQIVIKNNQKKLALLEREYTQLTNLNIDIFFSQAGTFKLEGMLVGPNSLKNLIILKDNGDTIFPTWKETQSGLTAAFYPPLEFKVRSGEVIKLFSDKLINETVYLSLWYYFDSKGGSILRPNIEQIYDDKKIEIYHLN